MDVRQVVDERGREVALKRARSAEEAARLRRESDVLQVAAHPGLVELVALDDGEVPELRTIWVAGRSLADAHPLDVEEVAGVVAATASTLADLHAVGLVHGAVEAAHVLLDEDGRPVLCGLGSGGLAGERCGSSLDAEDVLDPGADMAGLGAVLELLVARATGRVRGAGADALRRLAERATGPRADRPSARELADAIHDAVGGARLPRPAGEPPPEPAAPLSQARHSLEGLRRPAVRPVATGRRRLRLAGAGVASAAAVAAAVLALDGPPAPPVQRAAIASPTSTPTSVAPEEPSPPPTVAPRPPLPSGCPAVEAPLTADVDGDGCAEAVTFVSGVVEAAGWRWAVGQEGDVVAVGDWTCGGRRSLAVLRPSTGEVYAFSGWATAGADVAAPVVGRVVGGQALRTADIDGDGCNELVVERTNGAPAVLHPPRSSR